jgi:hypothetical protein
MQLRFRAYFLVVVCAAGLVACKDLGTGSGKGSGATNVDKGASESSSKCLSCHGPFTKLVASSTNYAAPSGEKTSPHRYVSAGPNQFVAHNSKEATAIPDCLNCHTAHPANPAKGSIDLKKVSVQWCYTKCHHKNDFTSCKECHETN